VASPNPRTDLPDGTVTLLFTDIEGSTQLLRALGARYAAVQHEHRALLRESFERHDGIEVDTQGDAFMVAFRSAADAAAAAVDGQRSLAAAEWPDKSRVLVRMGVHTGEPERGPEGYVGIDVVRAARIQAVAHGGQVIVSQLTRATRPSIWEGTASRTSRSRSASTSSSPKDLLSPSRPRGRSAVRRCRRCIIDS
jgi:class 3 adenylate cyclase